MFFQKCSTIFWGQKKKWGVNLFFRLPRGVKVHSSDISLSICLQQIIYRSDRSSTDQTDHLQIKQIIYISDRSYTDQTGHIQIRQIIYISDRSSRT